MKKNCFLLLGLFALLSVCLVSCSKDDDDKNDKPKVNNSPVGGAWQKEMESEIGDYTLRYYDVYNDDGTLREYLVWFDKDDKYSSSEYKDYNWAIEDDLLCLKLKEESFFTSKIKFKIENDKFYFFSAIDDSPIVDARRISLDQIQEYIDNATPAV